ncbi:unnamed protein product [Rhizophagus irregularis]|nr:unnamed protein product [Rhizophagus irregularis]
MYKSVFGKVKKLAAKPKPWRINLLLYLAHEGWLLIKKYVMRKFGRSKDISYVTFLDLLDNLIPATLDIYAYLFRNNKFEEYVDTIFRLWTTMRRFHRHNYDKIMLAFLSDICYWKKIQHPIINTLETHLNVFDEYPVENFHSLLRRHTSAKVSTGKSLRRDALFIDHCRHENSFVKSFEPKRDYLYSKKDLDDLVKLTAIFHLDFFNNLWKSPNKAELKKEGKRAKKDYIYFPGIETRFSFGALPLGYHSKHQPAIDKLCDRLECTDLSWDNGQVLTCGHGYHETCFHTLGLHCPHCFNYLSDSIEELSQSYNHRLRMSEDIDSWTDSQVQDEDEELENVETISKQIGIDIELKKKISEFVENCVPVESVELLPISGPILKDITNITGHQLKLLKNIEYYTDGSLTNQTINNNDLSHIIDNTTIDLRAAFYTNNELEEFLVYSCLSLWSSSTKAKIVAIFLALLTAPENSNVTIYTDSLSAINSINSAFNLTTRIWLKKINNLIIIKIIILIREAFINLKLVKIKGHSGITGNDIADKLAKKGQCGNNLFRNNVNFINNILSYFSVFIDNPIEVNIRRFILKILVTDEATEWNFTALTCELTIYELFIAKLFHKILPLGSILAIRKPRLYKEMKCIMKYNKKENWNYLFEYQAYKVAWEKILEITTKESIIIYLKQKQIRYQDEDFIRKVLQNILEVTAKSEKFQKFQQLVLEVKVKTFLTIKLQKDFKIFLAKAQTLMANILISI